MSDYREVDGEEMDRSKHGTIIVENTGPADELAAVRERLKALEKREKQLRDYLLAHPEDRFGKRFVASVVDVERQSVDWKELRANHPQIVEEFTFPAKVQQVVLHGISEDGEVLSRTETRKALAKQEVCR